MLKIIILYSFPGRSCWWHTVLRTCFALVEQRRLGLRPFDLLSLRGRNCVHFWWRGGAALGGCTNKKISFYYYKSRLLKAYFLLQIIFTANYIAVANFATVFPLQPFVLAKLVQIFKNK